MLSIRRSHTHGYRVFGYRLHKLHGVFGHQIDGMLQNRFGLTLSQYMILMAAAHRPSASQRRLARYLALTEAAVSRQIDTLVERQWLTRVIAEDNRREHAMGLTPQGRALLEQAEAALDEMWRDVLGVLTKDELHHLNHALEKLQRHFCPDINEESGEHGQA